MGTDRGLDVVVVGAGVSGLSCAAVLSRRGHAVLVIERHAQRLELRRGP
jgi:phytoene dehydrogenase-like protein